MAEKPEFPEELRDYFRRVAEEGNYPSQGGKARAEALSKKRRKEIAQKAAAARWGPKKEPKEKKDSGR